MDESNVICHFCSVGDRMVLRYSSVEKSAYFGPQAIPTIRYVQGDRGLCPRGNYCVKFTNHKRRFSYGWLEGSQRPVADVISYAKAVLGRIPGDRIAIVVSSSLTCEEALAVAEWAKGSGVKWVSISTPEDYSSAFLKNNFSFENIRNSQAIIAIGDIFSLHPTLTRIVHDVRTAKRGNFLAVIDSCRTRTARFSWNFFHVPPNDVPNVLKAIAMHLAGREYPIGSAGVSKEQIERFCDTLANVEKAVVLYAHGVGHFTESQRTGYWAQKIAEAKGFAFAGLSTGANARGIARIFKNYGFAFYETLSAISSGQVEALLCLGCDPIEAFPHLYGAISKVGFVVATAAMPTAITKVATAVIPSHFLFEKRGTILGIEENLEEIRTPISAPEYPGEAGLLKALGVSLPDRGRVEEILGNYRVDEIEPVEKESHQSDMWAIGYISPGHHGDGSLTRQDIWVERNTLAGDNLALIGQILSEKLGVNEGDTIAVETAVGRSEFTVEIENDQFTDVVLVPMYMPNARSIMRIENGVYVPTPARVRKV